MVGCNLIETSEHDLFLPLDNASTKTSFARPSWLPSWAVAQTYTAQTAGVALLAVLVCKVLLGSKPLLPNEEDTAHMALSAAVPSRELLRADKCRDDPE